MRDEESPEDLAPEPYSSKKVNDDLSIGSDPEANLTGQAAETYKKDPWKNSLADDELRAPDS